MLIRQGLRAAEGWEVANHAGRIGAAIADRLVGQWFGIFAFCIPAVLVILGLRIMKIKPVFLDKSIRIAFIVMILGSVSLGYLFGERGGMFGTGPGGEAGIAFAIWLGGFLGKVGLGVILLMGWALVTVYAMRNHISVFDRWRESFAEGCARRRNEREERRLAEREEKAAAAHAAAEEDARMEVAKEVPEPCSPFEDDETAVPGGDSVRETVPAQNGYAVGTSGIFELGDENAGEQLDGGRTAPPKRPAVMDEGDFEVIDIHGGRVNASSLREGTHTAPVIRKPAVAADDNIVIIDACHGGEGTDTEGSGSATVAAAGSPEVSMGAGGILLATDEDIEIVQKERRDAEAEEDELLFRDPTRKLPGYQKPPWQILEDHSVGVKISPEEIRANQAVIRSKLEDFGIRITDRIKATIGPTVTLYEIEPAQGVKISKIRNLEEDIALSLKVQSIRIVTLGQGRGTVGIEVPNSTREIVSMLSIINTRKFQDCTFKLPIALGRTIYNEIYIGDLTKMPHLLVAGATGQGKSVGLNAIITSLLYKKHPAELKFVLVDPKQVELSLYTRLQNHFLACMESEESPIITDTQKAVNTLNSLVQVMEERYTFLNKAGERNIADYNDKLQRGGLKKRDGHKFMPYIVVVIDEFADMIMTAGREAEMPITRLAAKARAVGIHLIVATQRPDVKVITGLIKSNIPARIAFKVVSMVDSRTIIDQPGANNLIGMGDMLMYLNGELTRIQCAFIDTHEIESVTSFIGKQQGFEKPYQLPHYAPPDPRGDKAFDKEDAGKFDPMFAEVARFVVAKDQGSTSAIQRNFELGYNRAGRITDQLERAGIVGAANGSKPREVLVKDLASLEVILFDMGM